MHNTLIIAMVAKNPPNVAFFQFDKILELLLYEIKVEEFSFY
jgi:hypothetical protein